MLYPKFIQFYTLKSWFLLLGYLLLSKRAYDDSIVYAIVLNTFKKYPLAVLVLHSYKVKVHFS